MPIIFELTTGTGTVVRYHRATRIDFKDGAFRVVASSWATKAMHDGAGPLAWQDSYGPVPPAALAADDPLAAAEAWLVAESSPMAGGAIDSPAEAADMTQAKARAWARVRASRDAFEFGTFSVDGIGRFDSDLASQQRIMGAVVAAQLSGPGAGWTIDWTLADNSVMTLDFAQMVLVGEGLAAHVSEAHERGRLLRALIDACQTVEAADAITWMSANGH